MRRNYIIYVYIVLLILRVYIIICKLIEMKVNELYNF